MSKRKLLLADDSVTIQKVVNLTFADEGIEVISVGDGNSAMDKFREDTPDIVLADVNMPGLNGYEFCEKIRQASEGVKIPVVLLVGSFEPFDESEAIRVGANEHIKKPFQSINQLVETVSRLLEAASNGDSDVAQFETQPLNSPFETPPPTVDYFSDDQGAASGSAIEINDSAGFVNYGNPVGGEEISQNEFASMPTERLSETMRDSALETGNSDESQTETQSDQTDSSMFADAAEPVPPIEASHAADGHSAGAYESDNFQDATFDDEMIEADKFDAQKGAAAPESPVIEDRGFEFGPSKPVEEEQSEFAFAGHQPLNELELEADYPDEPRTEIDSQDSPLSSTEDSSANAFVIVDSSNQAPNFDDTISMPNYSPPLIDNDEAPAKAKSEIQLDETDLLEVPGRKVPVIEFGDDDLPGVRVESENIEDSPESDTVLRESSPMDTLGEAEELDYEARLSNATPNEEIAYESEHNVANDKYFVDSTSYEVDDSDEANEFNVEGETVEQHVENSFEVEETRFETNEMVPLAEAQEEIALDMQPVAEDDSEPQPVQIEEGEMGSYSKPIELPSSFGDEPPVYESQVEGLDGLETPMPVNEAVSSAVSMPSGENESIAQRTDVTLSSETMDEIVARVVAQMSDRAVRDVAWEVVPQLADRIVRQIAEEKMDG